MNLLYVDLCRYSVCGFRVREALSISLEETLSDDGETPKALKDGVQEAFSSQPASQTAITSVIRVLQLCE